METTFSLVVALKLGAREYISQLYYKGEIYMRSIDYYTKCDHPEIGDRSEGLDLLLKDWQGKISHPNLLSEYNVNISSFKLNISKDNLHIYCMTGVTDSFLNSNKDSNNNVTINPGDFGNTLCIIKNFDEFVRRFEHACEECGYKFSGPYKVFYYDENTYCGALTPIHKRSFYEHQQEIRFLVTAEDNKPIKLKIGSLEDIAELKFVENNK